MGIIEQLNQNFKRPPLRWRITEGSEIVTMAFLKRKGFSRELVDRMRSKWIERGLDCEIVEDDDGYRFVTNAAKAEKFLEVAKYVNELSPEFNDFSAVNDVAFKIWKKDKSKGKREFETRDFQLWEMIEEKEGVKEIRSIKLDEESANKVVYDLKEKGLVCKVVGVEDGGKFYRIVTDSTKVDNFHAIKPADLMCSADGTTITILTEKLNSLGPAEIGSCLDMACSAFPNFNNICIRVKYGKSEQGIKDMDDGEAKFTTLKAFCEDHNVTCKVNYSMKEADAPLDREVREINKAVEKAQRKRAYKKAHLEDVDNLLQGGSKEGATFLGRLPRDLYRAAIAPKVSEGNLERDEKEKENKLPRRPVKRDGK